MLLKFRDIMFALTVLACCAVPTQASYLQKAEEATDFIQKNFYDASAQRYHPDLPVDPKKLPWDFMWGNGVIYSDLALAARHDPAKYKDDLYAFSSSLESNYWDPQCPVPGFNAYCSGPHGTDKYYDDNAWMVRGYLEAYAATHDSHFLDMAGKTQTFVLSGWDDVLGGGIYWRLNHEGKSTCANAPAAAAALALARVDGDRDQLAWADAIRAWVNKRLQAPNGLYYDGLDLKGSIGDTQWTYNTALMIIADGEFYQVDHDPADLKEMRRIADVALATWTDPSTGSLHKTEDSPLFVQLLCEALLRTYDLTHDVKYLDAVRREAAFAYKVGRDPRGGYWEKWGAKPHDSSERKTLIINASAARIFWLLADYPDH
jgi:uncharacterized protein YyaL (SSP411 family)